MLDAQIDRMREMDSTLADTAMHRAVAPSTEDLEKGDGPTITQCHDLRGYRFEGYGDYIFAVSRFADRATPQLARPIKIGTHGQAVTRVRELLEHVTMVIARGGELCNDRAACAPLCSIRCSPR